MYCMYARKEASEAPRTHFRACKIAKFPGGVPPPPSHKLYYGPPTFHICPGPPQSSRRPWLVESIGCASSNPSHNSMMLVHHLIGGRRMASQEWSQQRGNVANSAYTHTHTHIAHSITHYYITITLFGCLLYLCLQPKFGRS